MAPLRIAFLSDTHLPALVRQLDELWAEAAAFFAGADLILHAGDVTAPTVLDWLEQFAPVVVARGNNDGFDDPRMQSRQILDLLGWRIGMVHNLAPELRPLPLLAERFFDGAVDVMLAGHTHLERIRHEDGLLLINAGSPILPHHKETRLGCAGMIELTPERLRVEIQPLGHTPGRPNPTRHLCHEATRSGSAPGAGPLEQVEPAQSLHVVPEPPARSPHDTELRRAEGREAALDG